MMAKKLALVFTFAFFLNLLWENLHSALYAHYQGGPITGLVLTRAAFWDAVFITALATLLTLIPSFRGKRWLAIVISLVTAVWLERHALSTGRWAYNEYMPIIPLLKTGLTPTIQLAMLYYASISISNKIKL